MRWRSDRRETVHLTGAEFDTLESIARADFSQVQGLSEDLRKRLLDYPLEQLDTWNSFTRKTTR